MKDFWEGLQDETRAGTPPLGGGGFPHGNHGFSLFGLCCSALLLGPEQSIGPLLDFCPAFTFKSRQLHFRLFPRGGLSMQQECQGNCPLCTSRVRSSVTGYDNLPFRSSFFSN